MDEHGHTEYSKYDIDFPADVLESRRNEVCECEVEDPVRGCGERNGFATYAEGVQFWWVDPTHRPPRWCVGGDEEVGTCDDGFCCWPSDRN